MRPFVLVPGYEYVFSSSLVSQALCPAACSGRGSCVNGTCACLPGWSAADCSVPSCDTCPLRSTCDAQVVFNGLHAHSSHWFLRKCNAHSVSKHTTRPSLALAKQAVPPTCIHPHPPTLSVLWQAFCHCHVGWLGPACDTPATCYGVGNCTSAANGVCVDVDVCSCVHGYVGSDCSTPADCSSVGGCGDAGLCVRDGVCQCPPGLSGVGCADFECEGGCSDHGECLVPNVCECHDGWSGPSCR